MAIHEHIAARLNYDLVRKIAEGGMGIVYEAIQHGAGQFRKRVAIKVIREEFSAIPAFRNNFIGEARLVADLIHTNIVQTYHLGEVEGQYYMVLEYVRGVNLDAFLEGHRARKRPVPVPIAVFIVSRVARGLAYAHAKTDGAGQRLGIVHRDVNPKNVLLAGEGDVKLTDFGIAKALDLMYNEEGKVIAGKDEYLSPEQASYQVTDGRADLFALCIVLSELLLGRNIFRDRDRPGTLRNILELPIPSFHALRPDIDPRLDAILQRGLQRDRQKRHASADELLHELEVYLYSGGYGPTNEKLAIYLRDLFAADPGRAANPTPAPEGRA